MSSGFDQIAEEASSEAASNRAAGGRKKGSSQEEGSQVKSLACQARDDDQQDPGSSAEPVNMVLILSLIQAVSFSNHS